MDRAQEMAAMSKYWQANARQFLKLDTPREAFLNAFSNASPQDRRKQLVEAGKSLRSGVAKFSENPRRHAAAIRALKNYMLDNAATFQKFQIAPKDYLARFAESDEQEKQQMLDEAGINEFQLDDEAAKDWENASSMPRDERDRRAIHKPVSELVDKFSALAQQYGWTSPGLTQAIEKLILDGPGDKTKRAAS